MKKSTKVERDLHQQAEELLWGSDKALTVEEVEFVYTNWSPHIDHAVEAGGAFFTPPGMAQAFAQHAPADGRVVDICAGTGMLLWAMMLRQGYGYRLSMGSYTELVAVESAYSYVQVGKRLLPDVTWIEADALDRETWVRLGKFDAAVSNPPFGKVLANSRAASEWLAYQGANDLMFAEVALRIAGGVTMILPQSSTPYEYRTDYYGRGGFYQNKDSGEWLKFQGALPGVEFHPSSLPTTQWESQWKGANPKTEIVSLEVEWAGHPLGLDSRVANGVAQLAFL